MVGPDGLAYGREAVIRQPPREAPRDGARQAGPVAGERGVELEQARAGADAGVGRCGRIDAAHPDQREPPAARGVSAPQDEEGTGGQRRAAEAARLGLRGRAQAGGARRGGVGENQAGDGRATNGGHERFQRLVVDVGGELQEDGRAGGEAGVGRREGVQQAGQGGAALPGAQARCVRRGDVHGHVVGQRGDARERGGVVPRRIRAVPVHTDIDAERAGAGAGPKPPPLEPPGDRLQTRAVEAEPFNGRSYSDRDRIRVEKNSFAALLDSKLSLSTRYFGGEDEFSLDGCRIALSREAEGEDCAKETAAAGDASSPGAEPAADLMYLEPLYEPQEPKSRKVLSRLPDIFSPISRARDPERAGSIMHRFLEVWDFREETVKRETDFVLGEFLASNPDMRALLRELSSGFLASELLSIVRGADRVEKELKFVVSTRENGPKRGRIDLLTEDGEGVRLFDYKYRESMNDRALEDYGRQMDGYGEAVRSRFEKPLLSRHIVLIPSVELVPI